MKRTCLTLGLLIVLSFCSIPTTLLFAQQYNWKLGHVVAPTHPFQLACVEFAKAVEKDSNGRIKIEVHHSGDLGSEKDLVEQIRFGALEMGLINTGALQGIERKMEVEELPYAWPTRQHAYAALDGKLGQKLKELAEPKGIYILAWAENGYRHMTNNVRPINTPDDCKGLKIRSAEVSMRLDSFKLLGIQPTPIPFTELFMALQQGTVDGAEAPLAVLYSSKFYEVQKYLSLTGHIWGSANFEINKSLWDKLPADLQTIIQKNATACAEYERKLIQQSDVNIITELKNKGMKINEIDTRPFKTATSPIFKKYEEVFGKELMDLVKIYSSK